MSWLVCVGLFASSLGEAATPQVSAVAQTPAADEKAVSLLVGASVGSEPLSSGAPSHLVRASVGAQSWFGLGLHVVTTVGELPSGAGGDYRARLLGVDGELRYAPLHRRLFSPWVGVGYGLTWSVAAVHVCRARCEVESVTGLSSGPVFGAGVDLRVHPQVKLGLAAALRTRSWLEDLDGAVAEMNVFALTVGTTVRL